jgi:hypothetical protein
MRLIRGTQWRSLLLGLPMAALGAYLTWQAVLLYWVRYRTFLNSDEELRTALADAGVGSSVYAFDIALLAGAVLMLLAGCAGILAPRERTLRLMRKSCGAYYVLFIVYAYLVNGITNLLHGAEVEAITGTKPTAQDAFYWTWDFVVPYGLVAVAIFFFVHVQLWRRRTINHFTGEDETASAWGDRFLERLRIHGDDPQYRKSVYGSVFIHFAVLILIPWLLSLIGCVKDYRVPKGRGNPVVALVQVVKPKQKKKKKEFIVNPHSSIRFEKLDIEKDSKIMEEVERETELPYKAVSNAQGGKMGQGGEGEGGWPDGMEDALVRFIRLRHNGANWDDGMDMETRADMNFLDFFHGLTGFPIADQGEAHPVGWLSKYRKGFAPPFVYMTGSSGFSLNNYEEKALRKYLLGGGLLFGDCGGPGFDRAFRRAVRQVLPGKEFVEISDDDPLFNQPFVFEDGAPPLWHHGGFRAMGVKHNGRWCVFYHPGDLNDAWKTGNSGVAKNVADHAMQMGINVVYYSFTHYLEITRKYRK